MEDSVRELMNHALPQLQIEMLHVAIITVVSLNLI
jgi:hypothetical protein